MIKFVVILICVSMMTLCIVILRIIHTLFIIKRELNVLSDNVEAMTLHLIDIENDINNNKNKMELKNER